MPQVVLHNAQQSVIVRCPTVCASFGRVHVQAAVERVEKQMEQMGDITTDYRAGQVGQTQQPANRWPPQPSGLQQVQVC